MVHKCFIMAAAIFRDFDLQASETQRLASMLCFAEAWVAVIRFDSLLV